MVISPPASRDPERRHSCQGTVTLDRLVRGATGGADGRPQTGNAADRGLVVDLPSLITYHQFVLESEQRSAATMRQYLYFHRVFLRYLEHAGIEPTLDALNQTNLRSAATWYGKQADGHRSRNGEVAQQALVDLTKRLGAFAEEEGILPDNPLRRVKRLRVTEHLPEPFSQQEINALWAASRSTAQPQRDEALLFLLLDTGMRIGEACGLVRANLHLEGPDRYVLVGAIGKSRRQRRVPLGDPSKRDGGRTVRALRIYIQHARRSSRSGESVFLARDGFALTPGGGYDVFQRLGKLAGVADCHPHRCRHTFCTRYLEQFAGDELGLRRIVGHLSKPVLARYVHLAESTVAQRRAQASLVERMTGAVLAHNRTG